VACDHGWHTLLTVTEARADRANRLVAADTATGGIRWSVSVGGAHVDTPIAIDHGQYFPFLAR
jgi:hypothetical protein